MSAPRKSVKEIAVKSPWLIPVLSRLVSAGGAVDAKTIAEKMNVNVYPVKRALWWLKKYGYVEEEAGIPKKYKLKFYEDQLLRELPLRRRTCGNTELYDLGELYVVAIFRRRDEYIAKSIPASIVEEVRRHIDAGLAIEELVAKLSIPEQLSTLALRVLSVLNCKEGKEKK